MILELSIRNLAIIDDICIRMEDGFTIFSGETGAGKSIIINAINLLLGARATSRLVRAGSDAAEVEALFRVRKDSEVESRMLESGFDPSEGLLVRRIISADDRHRIYINDRIATLKLLTSLTQNLAAISGQHAHQSLLREDEHLFILDRFGGLERFREKVSECYNRIVPLVRELDEQKALMARRAEQIELLEFQKKEISEAGIKPGEDDTLETERARLKNAEVLLKTVFKAVGTLYDSRGAVFEVIDEISKDLEKAAAIDDGLSESFKAVDDVKYRIEDVVESLRSYQKRLSFDEKRLDEVEERLDLIKRMKRKYGGSIETVLFHLESVDEKLQTIGNLDDVIADIEADLENSHREFSELCRELSKKRKEAARELAGLVETELHSLEMPATKFEVSIYSTPSQTEKRSYLDVDGMAADSSGIDRAAFLIAPNPGEPLKPLAEIASGGELSRVVLALKAILSETDSVETVIFDEVDAGIGGKTAKVVGEKLKALSSRHQVVCITHLPQIAKFGTHHFRISKHVESGKTRTRIELLDPEERVKEISRMIGGSETSKMSLDHAREMLVNASSHSHRN